MIRRLQVSTPGCDQPRKLAVITCHYNFADFKRPQANLLRFLRQMERDGVPVYGAELRLPHQKPLVSGNPNWQCLKADPERHVLWQKEALLNLALRRVPPEYNAIAWIDGDVTFMDPNWAVKTESVLACVDVVQPFSEALWTDEDGRITTRRSSSTSVGLDRNWRGHPGFAWAARREVLNRCGGLYPFTLVGNGDTLMALAFMGRPVLESWKGKLGADSTAYDSWKGALGRLSIGTVHGRLVHEWHGHRKDRQYTARSELVKGLVFAEAATLDDNGLLGWADHIPTETRKAVSEFFRKRKEDGR